MISNALDKLKSELKDKKLDGVLVSSVANIIHFTGYSNFSIEEREAYILITEKSQYILTDGRYSEAIIKQVKEFELVEISPLNPLKKLLKNLSKKHEIKSLGVQEEDLKVKEHKEFKKIFKNLKHVDLKKVRSIKTEKDLKKIEKACKLGDEVFEYVIKKVLKEGISEKQVVHEIDNFLKKNNSETSFKPIVAFGENSSVPHHESGNKKLTNGFVLLDLGAKFENYCSDMTRTVFFGKASQKQKKIYFTVLKAQQKAMEYVNKNAGKEIRAKEVDKVARDYIISKGFKTIPHSLGHGTGIAVHEHPSLTPKSKDILKEGMVFSIEPGIYIPRFGGVRMEDLFVLEKNGLRQLTKSPKTLIELL